MAERTLIVKVLGDTTNLEKNLGKATKTTKGFELSLKNLAKAAGGVFAAREIARGLEDIISKAEESQVSMSKLEAATKSSGVSMKTFAGELDKAQAAGRKLGFTNIETQGALAKLVVATQSGTQAVRDLSTAQDLARFKHIDVAAAAQMLSQAMTGSARAVKQLGINVIPLTTNLTALKAAHKAAGTAASQQEIAAAKLADKQATGAKIIEIVTQRLHGQADAYSKTTAGAMARFRAALEDIEERIGSKLLPVLTRWVNYISDHLPQIERFMKNVADKANAVADAFGGWKPVLEALAAVWILRFTGMLKPITALIGKGGVGGTGVAGLRSNLASLARFGAAGIAIPVWINIGTHFLGSSTKSLIEKLLKFGLPQFIPVTIIAKGIQSAVSGGTMSPKDAHDQFIKDAMANGMTRTEAERAYRDRSGRGRGSSVNAGGKAGSLRGYGGAGPVLHAPRTGGGVAGHGGSQTGGEGHDASVSFLGGTPRGGTEHDWSASPGTTVLAPEAGVCYAHGGHDPSTGIHPHNVFGWSLIFQGDSGTTYAGTHLAKVYPGRKQDGDPIGVIGTTKGWTPHLHWETRGGGGTTKGPPVFGPSGGSTGGGSSGGGRGGGGGAPSRGLPTFSAITKSVTGAVAGRAPSPFGAIGGRIAADVTGATAVVGSSLDRMRAMIAARAAAIRAAIQKARADVVSSFGQFSSNVISAFDAINSAWKSPASQALAKMQAEDAMKSAVDAYAQAVKEFGADSPEAQAAARALEEAKLEAQAKAEEEAHDAKVKADKDALEKQLAALEKEAAGAKTKAAAARIRKKINDLLASYGITPDTVAAATDWQTAQTLFVSSLGNLISSIDALTNAINGQGAKASGPPTSAGQGDRGTDSGAPGSPPGGRGGHPPPEFASGGAVPIMAHAGEYILRSSATRKIGVGNLNYMNRTGLLPSFQTGGLLDPTDSSGNPISMTSAVGSGVPYEIWRRKVAMAKYAKKEARISASRALWNPSRLPTPSSAADTLIDMWMEALGSDALFTERLGALKAFVDSGDAYRGGAVSRSWLTYGVPKLANGGYITRGGIAEVHRGETVTPAGAVHGPLVGELHVHNEVDEAHLVSKIGRAVYMLGIPS